MGLRQTISQWIATIKDTLDLGPGFPAAVTEHHTTLADELAKLQHLLEQTQKVAQEKDELIAQLQAAGMVQGNMVVDGPAYYVQNDSILDGPFCTCCFEQRHEIARIVLAPQPTDVEGDPAEWVQCGQCQTPFRSERLGQYLNPRKTASGGAAVLPEEKDETKPVKAARKPRAPARPLKNQPSEPTKATLRRRTLRS